VGSKDSKMKTIKLTQGKVTKVDDDDYEQLNKWLWYVNNKGIAVCNRQGGDGKILMHRFILRLSTKAPDVDHINGDKLDNRKKNLRLCTKSQNQANRGKQINNTSGFKGVFELNEKWLAQIRFNGRSIYLGTYASKIQAAKAYDKAAVRYYGEFAKLNFES
jgi:hypothetical protein